jgi:hypothetical protein
MNRTIKEPGQFIEQSIEALGGRDALRGVTSLYSQLERCLWMVEQDPCTMRVDVYRARGGRIRFEEFTTETDRTVFIVNGLSGARQRRRLVDEKFIIDEQRELDALEVEQIKRGVRLYPRNFLAHADEHQYDLCGIQEVSGESVYLLSLPVEEVAYHFDPETLRCLRMIDRRTDSVTTYEDYRDVSGVITPFIERVVQAQRNFRVDTIKSIDYNLDLEDSLFSI